MQWKNEWVSYMHEGKVKEAEELHRHIRNLPPNWMHIEKEQNLSAKTRFTAPSSMCMPLAGMTWQSISNKNDTSARRSTGNMMIIRSIVKCAN